MFLQDHIYDINNEVEKKRKKGETVYGFVIGMFFWRRDELPVSKNLLKILSKHNSTYDLTYPKVKGPDTYMKVTAEWFFNKELLRDYINKKINGIATIGGTGAVALGVKASIFKRNITFFPSLSWPNYPSIVSNAGATPLDFNLFRGHEIDYSDLKNKLLNNINKYDSFSFLINDPCQNPTGLALKEKNWKDLYELIKRISSKYRKKKFSFIFDLAYIDFASDEEREICLKNIYKFSREYEIYICISYSKTLSLYGMRSGALYSNIKDIEFDERIVNTARATWSVPNHMVINSIIEYITNYKDELTANLSSQRKELERRYKLFIDNFKYPELIQNHDKGFFFVLKSKNSFALNEKLIKQNIYMVPLDNKHLRVSLGNTTDDEILYLVSNLNNIKE